MAEPLFLHIANDLSELSRLNEAVSAYLDPYNLSVKTRHTVDLAIEEMVTNIIKYGFDDEARHELGVSVAVTESGVSVRLEDDGREFNPLAQDDPDTTRSVEDRQLGGLGIHLVRRMLDDLSYERRCGRNVLRMLVGAEGEEGWADEN